MYFSFKCEREHICDQRAKPKIVFVDGASLCEDVFGARLSRNGGVIVIPPYVWFGGKRVMAKEIWNRLGDVKTYCEPFAGGASVWVLRPIEHFRRDLSDRSDGGARRWENLNDIDGLVVNFWRAVMARPDEVAHHATRLASAIDLRACNLVCAETAPTLTERLTLDPDYFDAKIAGLWVFGINNHIGPGFASGKGGWVRHAGRLVRRRDVGSFDPGINRSRIHSNLCGYQTQMQIRSSGLDPFDYRPYFRYLCDRIRGNGGTKWLCGDWKAVLTNSSTLHLGPPVGVFLDPPYGDDRAIVYRHDNTTLWKDVAAWAMERGDDPRFRIAVCGYVGYYEDTLGAAGWRSLLWTANGGMANRSRTRNAVNADREIIWFSPHCLHPDASGAPDRLL